MPSTGRACVRRSCNTPCRSGSTPRPPRLGSPVCPSPTPRLPRLLAPPVRCSCVGHYSPLHDNTAELKEGDLVKM